MKHHERESFIYMIRSGNTYLKKNIVIKPPTINQLVESYRVFDEAYSQSLSDEIMTEDEMIDWLKENLIWTKFNENRVESLKKDIENYKVEIYHSRQDPKKVKGIRFVIRDVEHNLEKELLIKNSQYQNTCEGIAQTAKISWLISNTTFVDNEPYDFSDVSLNEVVSLWQDSILNDSQCRELSRNEPWKSTWSISKNVRNRLFFNNEDTDLTLNQKNLIVWSQIYDNIYESIECPPKSVIDDDDMLDGWLILQNKKHEKSRAESDAENLLKNPKIKNAKEVLIVANNPEHIKNIQNLNDERGKHIIQQRFDTIEQLGTVSQDQLPDEKLNLHLQKMKMMKENLK